MVALGVLGQVADGLAVRLLVAVDPVEPHLLVLHLVLQQGRLQGGLSVWDQPGTEGGGEGRGWRAREGGGDGGERKRIDMSE